MTKPVYVLLVNTNGYRDTIECLESVLRSDYPALRVIVVDNASRDGSVDRLQAWAGGAEGPPVPRVDALRGLTEPPIRKPVGLTRMSRAEAERGGAVDWGDTRVLVVECASNLGFAGANNVGLRHVLRHAPTASALLLNNDTVIEPRAISRMMAAAEANRGAGAVGATLLQYYAPDRIETFGGARLVHSTGFSALIGTGHRREAERPSDVSMDFISGCCLLIPGESLARVGLLDERFFIYCEDTDWGLRLTRTGLALITATDAEVWHKGGATAVHRSEFHDYHNVKSVLHLIRKHRPAALPIAVPYSIARFVLPKLVRGQWGRLRAALRGYRDFWRELGLDAPDRPSLQVNDSVA